jgi:hemolysin activation/secretion protein
MGSRARRNGLNGLNSRPVVTLVIFGWALAAVSPAHASEPKPLASVAIAGSTVYSPAELFRTYRDRLGQPVSRALAQDVAAAIGRLYEENGYARPQMRLDESLAEEGVMQIRLSEPRISRVTIEGEPGAYRSRIEMIAAELVETVPLRRDAIAGKLEEMRRWPGLSVTAATRRDEAAPGAYELALEVEFAPIGGFARMNNRGTDEIGPLFLVSQVEANDFMGRGGELGLVLAGTGDPREYVGGAVYLDHPLGASGMRGMAMAFRSRAEPDERPVDADQVYERERFTLRLTRPVSHALTLTGGFEAEDLEISQDGSVFRDDRLRVLEAGARSAWRVGDSTQLSSLGKIRKGVDALGAGLRADDLADDPRTAGFLLAQLQLTSFTRIGDSWSLRLDALGQCSGHVLPDSERFKIGGERLGRGFEVTEIAGDHGLGGKALLRRELPSAELAIGRPSIYGFYDLAAAWKRDSPGRESAATVGAGAAMNGERLSAYVEVAKPLTHGDVEGKRSASIFAELTLRF